MISYRVSLLVLAAAWMSAACAKDDCTLNPNLECFPSGSGAGGTSMGGNAGAAGKPTGGSGGQSGSGGAACDVKSCPPPTDECQMAMCKPSGDCGFVDQKDGTACGMGGMLMCKAGVCSGCASATDCSPKDCNDAACDAKGSCVYTPNSAMSCGGDGMGSCMMGVCVSCSDGVMNGTETDVDCGGSCKKCGDGDKCKSTSDCNSEYCADGVCCSDKCDGDCQSCNQPDSPGLCAPIKAGTSDGMACMAPAKACGPGGDCLKANGQSCNGDSTTCASKLCNSGHCKACTGNSDCATKQVCIDGVCFDPAAQGALCQADAGCAMGLKCVDSVCCESACTGKCMGCNNHYTSKPQGTCAPILNGYDPQDECGGPGEAATCSGAAPDVNKDSSCGQ